MRCAGVPTRPPAVKPTIVHLGVLIDDQVALEPRQLQADERGVVVNGEAHGRTAV